MSNSSREEQLRTHATFAAERLGRLGEALAARQQSGGQTPGNVPPWPGSNDADFGGTLSAICVWGRAQALDAGSDFGRSIQAAWGFVRGAWSAFVPRALDAEPATEESAYDCALVLRAALVDPSARRAGPDSMPERAARLLAAHLGALDLESAAGGRAFEDPGFLVWSLAEYGRATADRGLVAVARRFVDRAFGMKPPAPFSAEPTAREGLFDFSSTTATRILAVMAAEGPTPLVGAWLRERIAPLAPSELLRRPMDENAWNACVAAALGRAFLVATDPAFLDVYRILVSALDARTAPPTFALGRAPGLNDDTKGTFYWALALDSLIRT